MQPRQTIYLSGTWHFAVDQDPEYHRSLDYSRETDLRHWERVPVPGCWNRYAERYDLFEGVAWLVREFDVAEVPAGAVARLHFGGVNYLADAYLNGRHVGSHEGGYTAFALDVSEALRPGRNRLAVRVDNRHLRTRLPAVLGWYHYGGIHRDVALVLTPGPQLISVVVAAEPAGSPVSGAGQTGRKGQTSPTGEEPPTAPCAASGVVRVAATPGEGPLRVVARVVGPTGEALWEGCAEGTGPWALPLDLENAQPWAPASPVLYRCEVELCAADRALDVQSVAFGVRSVEARAQQILLNGEPLRLNGMCYLYDHPESGVTMRPDLVARDLDDLQELGVNCLRSHFPPTEAFLAECDRRGMLLWLEVPIYCLAPPSEAGGSAFAEGSVQALALQMLREMVEGAANHPSVILCSVGNECNTEHPEAVAFFRACVEQIRALDPSRLIGYAALYGQVGCVADLVDVIGLNQYWGWYDRIAQDGTGGREPAVSLPIDLPALEACLAEKSALGKPLLMTEFGADAEPGFHSAGHELWSEEYQAALMARQLEVMARFPAVCGTFPFCYCDYRDPSKPINQHWHGVNLKGIVDYYRRRKMAWERVREAYT